MAIPVSKRREIKRMADEGKAYAEIAAALKVSHGTIAKYSGKKKPRAQPKERCWLDELQTILSVNISENLKKAAIRELVSG